MRNFLTIISLGLLLSSPCWAQFEENSRNGGRFGDRFGEDRGPRGREFRDQDGERSRDPRGRRRPSNLMFEVIDTDGNQMIDARELRKALSALKTLDADGDGNISLEEVTPEGGLGGPGGPGGPGGRGGEARGRGGRDQSRFVDRIMEQNDKNGDDMLSPDEVNDRLREMLKGGDTNGDRLIDREELAAILANGGGRFDGRRGGLRGDNAEEIAQELMSYDQNGDGMLKPDEIPSETLRMLQGADLNGDKYLNSKEVAAAAERIAEQNSRRGGRGRAGGRGGAAPEGADEEIPYNGPPRPERRQQN